MRILKWVLIIAGWLVGRPLTVSPNEKSEGIRSMTKKWARETEFDHQKYFEEKQEAIRG